MAYTSESDKFVQALIDNDALFNGAKEWMRENLEPDEVFSDEKLIGYVKDNYNLTDVFDSDELENWALENGFTKT